MPLSALALVTRAPGGGVYWVAAEGIHIQARGRVGWRWGETPGFGVRTTRAQPEKASAFLAHLATEFTVVLSLAELVDHTLNLLSEEAGFDSCTVGLLDEPQKDTITLVGAAGIRSDFKGLIVPRGRGLNWTIVESGQPLYVPDMLADRRVYRQDDRIRSGIYAPLITGGRVIGVLSAHRGQVDAFEPEDLDVLTVVARYLSGAIEVARLHEQLRERRDELRTIVEASPLAIYTLDRDCLTITGWNPAAERILGWPADEVIGKPLSTLPPAAHHEFEMLRTVALQKQHLRGIRTQGVRKDGAPVHLNLAAAPLLDASGTISGFLIILEDITERQRAEDAMRESERRFRRLFENAPIGMCLYSVDSKRLDSRLLRVNAALCEMLGYTEAELTSLRTHDITHPDQVARSSELARDMFSRDPRAGPLEKRYLTKDGRVVWARLTTRAFPSPEAGLQNRVAMIENITARKHAELREKDRNRVLEMLAGNEPLEEVLRAVTQLIDDQRPEMVSAVIVALPGEGVRVATSSLPAAMAEAVAGVGLGTAGGPWESRDALSEGDWRGPLSDPYRELALGHGWGDCWAAPILSGAGEPLGAVTVYALRPCQLEQRDLDLLETARRLAAVAIDQRRLADRLVHQACHDTLTGLPNRALYEDRLRHAVKEADREGRMVALMLVDLDRFKRINDTLGHHIGDQLLVESARRFQGCIRAPDTLARWGGDEFTVILTGLHTPQDAVPVAERLLEAIRRPFRLEGHDLFLTATIGISLYPTDSRAPDELLRHADIAMYRAEEQGKNTYEFFAPEVGAAASERLRIENELRGAIDRGELEIHYQPQVAVRSGSLVAVEALLRWNHPERGLLSADQFISIAEESGLIVPIGSWLLEEACRQTRSWHRAGYGPSLRVAVNVSAVQFRRHDFIEGVVRTLEQAGLAPEFLELELVESLMMRDIEASTQQINGLRALGVTIALDDFGTGYSSLSYLHQFRIDALKIGQSFIHGLDGAESTRLLVQAIVAVARNLGIPATAEGVETPRQLRFLRRLGCERAQGFLLGKPLPVKEFEAFLERSQSVRRVAK